MFPCRSEHIFPFGSGPCSLHAPGGFGFRLLGSGLPFRALASRASGFPRIHRFLINRLELRMNLDIRYVAGLFDGEGWITINVIPLGSIKGRHRYTENYVRYQLFVGIGMNYYPIIAQMSLQFGGLLHRNDSANRRLGPANRISYQWRLSSRAARDFLLQIEPFLIVKKEEAQLAIEFQAHMRKECQTTRYHPERREELYAYRQGIVDRLRELKQRAFDVPNGSDPSLPVPHYLCDAKAKSI